MGTYISQTDVENVFGTRNVAQWSNLDQTTTVVDTARVALAISYAETVVEERFRGSKYAVPFAATGSAIPVTLKDWCAKLAGVWLYENRGGRDSARDDAAVTNRIQFHKKSALDEMDFVLSGQRRMALARSHTGPTAPSIARVGMPRLGGRHVLP